MKELGIRFDKIAQFFSMHVWETPSVRGKTVRNIVGKRWMTDEEIDLLFNMLNATQRNDIFFVCKPSRFLYAFSNIKDKIQEKPRHIEKVFVVLNVGCNKDGTTYITNTEKQGSHWSLLVIDINNVILL